MKRIILAGILSMAAGLSGLMAQPPATPPAQTEAPAAPKGPQPKSQDELKALQALFNPQNDPDTAIKAAEDLLTKFADTDFKEVALFLEANAYRMKNDYVKAQIYAEKANAINPKDVQASLMLGEILAQRTRENDLDKEEKLTKSEKLLNDTIENLKTITKPNPQIPDKEWEDQKKAWTAQAQSDLGLCALTRRKYDVAVFNFQLAIGNDPQPAYETRLASAYQQSGKNDEAITLCDKILAEPQLHPQIKSVVTNIRADAVKAKGPAK